MPDRATTSLRLALAGNSLPAMALVVALTLAATLVEGLGVALVYPILEVMRARDTAAGLEGLGGQSEVLGWIVEAFHAVGLNPTLPVLMVAAVVLVLVRQGFVYASTVVRARFSYTAVARLASGLFEQLTEADLQTAEASRSGSLLNALITESKRAAMLGLAVLNVVSGLIKLAVYGVLMLLLSWQATAVAAAVVLLFWLVLSRGIIRHSLGAGRDLNSAQDQLTRFASERLRLFRLIKLARTEGLETALFRDRNLAVRDGQVALTRHAARLTAAIEPAAVILALGALYVATEPLGMNLSTVGVFVLILFRLVPVMQEVATNQQQIAAYRGSLELIHRLSATAEAARERDTGGRPFPPLRDGIRLEGVSFVYPPADDAETARPPALHDISLHLPAGKTVALLGPSGAGKSTLVDLLPRLKEPTAGRVTFDGVDARAIALADLRAHVALVSQEILLIDDTVEENLRYGHPGATAEAVRAAARAAHADSFIEALPQGYATVLGERGARLSGGQKQRIALARAFLARVPVLLLDEPTSALDADSEKAVQAAIATYQRDIGGIVVIIAHRLSTVAHADLAAILEDGRLTAIGGHRALTDSSPWYRRFVELQTRTLDDGARSQAP